MGPRLSAGGVTVGHVAKKTAEVTGSVVFQTGPLGMSSVFLSGLREAVCP